MNILVTGGAGFIGSHFVRALLDDPADHRVINLDKLTYAGNSDNLDGITHHPRHRFVRGDIADAGAVDQLFRDGVDAAVNFAAESHVDRSILDAAPFVRTNITGTQVLLEAARRHGVRRFIQISTDEVYGPARDGEAFPEDALLRPSSPYAASKAAADLLCLAYRTTYGLPVVITRSTNNYGPRQFPEKFIPLTITNALEGRPIPIYGDGRQERDWLHVEDHCAALLAVWRAADPPPILNIGSGQTVPNIALASMILQALGSPESLMQFVRDRPGHDRRYALDTTVIASTLGWQPRIDLQQGVADTVAWYVHHRLWWTRLKSNEYRRYYAVWYGDRLNTPAEA